MWGSRTRIGYQLLEGYHLIDMHWKREEERPCVEDQTGPSRAETRAPHLDGISTGRPRPPESAWSESELVAEERSPTAELRLTARGKLLPLANLPHRYGDGPVRQDLAVRARMISAKMAQIPWLLHLH
jgi:hypothetical protein